MIRRNTSTGTTRPAIRSAWTMALVCLALLVAGCGVTKEVTNYVGDYFQATDTNLKKRIVVAPFATGLPELQKRSTEVGQGVAKLLSAKGNILLVDFDRLAEAVRKVDPAVKNPEDRIVAAGRELGLNAILSGAISDLSVRRHLSGVYGFRDNSPFLTLEVDLKLIDVGTGTVLGEHVAHTEEKIDEVMAEGIAQGQKLPVKTVDKLQAEIIPLAEEWVTDTIDSQPWYGYVIEVKDGRVLTTVGKNTGLAAGSLLTVYAKGEEILCATGQTVCLPGPRAGQVAIVELMEDTAWAKPVPEEKKDGKETVVPEFKHGWILRTR